MRPSTSPSRQPLGGSRTIHWVDLSEEERERYTRFVVDNKVQVRMYPHAKGPCRGLLEMHPPALPHFFFCCLAHPTPQLSLSLYFYPCL